MWRNWQTRMVQVHVLARVWRFKSSHPHQILRYLNSRNQSRIRLEKAVMATIASVISLDEYLNTTYEPDMEFVQRPARGA